MPSETCRFTFTMSWLSGDHFAANYLRLECPRLITTTARSPRCRRTAVLKDGHNTDRLPRVG
jgi:hypothetical protein